MRNEQIFTEVVKQGEALRYITEKINAIHETDKEQTMWLQKSNGRITTLETKVIELEKDTEKLENKTDMGKFIDKHFKWIVLVGLALAGFGPDIIKALV